jgi:hypothetical protein
VIRGLSFFRPQVPPFCVIESYLSAWPPMIPIAGALLFTAGAISSAHSMAQSMDPNHACGREMRAGRRAERDPLTVVRKEILFSWSRNFAPLHPAVRRWPAGPRNRWDTRRHGPGPTCP